MDEPDNYIPISITAAPSMSATKTEITSLRYLFGDSITDQKGIANLLNYRFSKLGNCLGKQDENV